MEIKEIQELVVEWADEVFPERKPYNALTKLVMEEIPELALNQTSEDEFADCLLLLLDYAHLVGIDPEKAVLRKMDVNRAREWEKDPDTGLINHVKDT